MSEYLVKGETLVALADTARAKSGFTNPIVFPEGFAELFVTEEEKFAAIVYNSRISSTNARYLFRDCSTLEMAPLFDASKFTTVTGMFENCSSLTTVPAYDTSAAKNMNYTFQNCTKLKEIPLLPTSNVETMDGTFSGCSNLLSIPLLDTRNVRISNYMFERCFSLVTVPRIDMRSVTSATGMFSACTKMTNCLVRNIKVSTQVGSGATWGHLLTVDSLIHIIYECRDTGSNKTLTIGSANMEKLANTYVKTIDITDEMRAEDDLIDEKLPFVVCDSTDEGAMLITSYVRLKNWTLA